jgi:hypothetical protein
MRNLICPLYSVLPCGTGPDVHDRQQGRDRGTPVCRGGGPCRGRDVSEAAEQGVQCGLPVLDCAALGRGPLVGVQPLGHHVELVGGQPYYFDYQFSESTMLESCRWLAVV